MNGHIWLATACAGLFAVVVAAAGDGPLTYPQTKRTDFTETIHGQTVADPYRWLEDDVRKSPEVAAWVAAENEVTNAYLKAIPGRDTIQKTLTDLWNYERYGVPMKIAGKYYFQKNDGLQNQAVLYVADSPTGEPKLVLDPNSWSKDGTVALGFIDFSDDGKYLAFGRNEAGSDWTTVRVMDLTSLKMLDDELKWVKFSSAAWTKDGKGFFYCRYDEPAAGAQFQSTNLNQKVFYHKIGAPQAEDELVYKRPDHPDWGFQTSTSEDGHYLVLTSWKGTAHKYRLAYRDLTRPGSPIVDVVDEFENDYSFLGNIGSQLFFRTDLKAPRGRVIAIDVTKPEKENWKEIIPQAAEQLQSANLVGNKLFADYLKDAHSQIKVFDVAGKLEREVTLPTIGTATGFGGKQTDTETFYSFSSFATPPSIYRYDIAAGAGELIRSSKVKFSAGQYEVKQVFVPSKDGTKVPMFITARVGTKLDGTNPVLLYGYGGFNISLTPNFAVTRAMWLDMGGIYAQANLRGGGEYGEEWHAAGTKAHKQNVFDDFISCAEWLVKEKYTQPSRLAIQGGSNGGLLVGACMTQRPDLYGACLPAVGVMDMLRFQKFTAGRFWVDDYGSADNAEDFKWLIKYSPYHNLKKGTKYPATLVTTADTDDRVVPGHSFKFTAMLQYCQAGPAPVLARIETRAGHGAGKPTSKQIEEVADQLAFLVKNLGMSVPGVSAGGRR